MLHSSSEHIMVKNATPHQRDDIFLMKGSQLDHTITNCFHAVMYMENNYVIQYNIIPLTMPNWFQVHTSGLADFVPWLHYVLSLIIYLLPCAAWAQAGLSIRFCQSVSQSVSQSVNVLNILWADQFGST